jgi:thymidylate synthase ThyX
MFEGIGAELVWDGDTQVRIPEKMGAPRPGQMDGTTAERLTELSGRVCYDPATELLTHEGWVSFAELQPGVEVATLNADTNRMEFQVPTDYIRKPYSGKMYRVDSSKVSIFVTPEHNLFVADLKRDNWKLRSAQDMAGQRYRVVRYARYDANEAAPIEMPGHRYEQHIGRNKTRITRTATGHLIDTHQLPAWAALLGYYISEGHLYFQKTGSAPKIVLYQKAKNAQPLLDAVSGCGFIARTSLDDRSDVLQMRVGGAALARYLKPFGSLAANKRLPSYVFEWPAHLREILLDALMYGDGTLSKQGIRIYNTSSKQLADDVQRLIIGLGRPASINHSECDSCHMYRVRETAYGEASVNKHKRQDEWVDYSGEVFCVSVPNGILVTRRDEKVVVCGNCYDSMGSKTSRNSAEYIEHILQVGHTSIAEHYNATILLESELSGFASTLATVMVNRPGTWVTLTPRGGRVTLNCRSAMEFDRWSRTMSGLVPDFPISESMHIGAIIRSEFHKIAPRLIKQPHPAELDMSTDRLKITHSGAVPPVSDAEKWITVYTYGSRGFSHELVRHGDFTAMCLGGDNVVTFVNKKGIAYSGNVGAGVRTMRWLYERWQDPRLRSTIRKLRPRVLDEATGKFVPGKLLDVITSGKKPCFKISLANGSEITCTKDHRIYTDRGWLTLDEIAQPVLAQQAVQWNKNSGIKIAANGIETVEVPLHEQDYAETLLLAIRSPVPYIPFDRKRPHGKRVVKVHYVEITSITYVGEIDTYDLVLEGPNHGFVANGIVVHNSQRSTRYCEESESPWTIHPLIQGYLQDESNTLRVNREHGREMITDTIAKCRHAYKWWVDILVPYVADRIKDDPYAKTTARKQARGAARGFLGNALETELIFSATVMQWRHIFRMRAAQAADGEIRVASCAALGACKGSRYGDRFSDLSLVEAGDGTGLMLAGGGAA